MRTIYNVAYVIAAIICVPLLIYLTVGLLLCLALPSAMFGKRYAPVPDDYQYGHKPDDTWLVK